jgi:hypothetical protein
MSTMTEPIDAAIEPWRQFTLRDAFVLVGGWCAGFAVAAQQQRAENLLDHRWRRATDIEWLLWGFLVGGVLAAACLFRLQRAVAGRPTRLSFGEGLAFYPVVALAVSTMLLLILFAIGIFFDGGLLFEIGVIVLAVLHYGFGVLALVLLFAPPPRTACPWTHRLGCWNAILSVVCFLLHTLQRSWIYIDL